MFAIVKKYFNWLQKDNPTGDVVLYPELNLEGETSLKGVYIVGDLTGIPLLKLATNGASDIVKKLTFEQWKKTKKLIDQVEDGLKSKQGDKNIYDVVIVGAGPAGISAALECKRRGYSYIVLEATNQTFNTLRNFPKGKPMFYEPKGLKETTDVTLVGKTKEDLLKHLGNVVEKHKPRIEFEKKVEKIELTKDGYNQIFTADKKTYITKKTILATGKSGHSRKLGVPGEDLSHVYNKLYDPLEFKGKKVLIVGGGDSALEGAQLLVKAGAQVTISYRNEEFSRPKPDNIQAVLDLQKQKKLEVIFKSEVTKITDKEVSFEVEEKSLKKEFDVVFTLIGTQLPYEFFAKSGIKIENEKSKITYWWMALSVAFMNVIYFGKASSGLSDHAQADLVGQVFTGSPAEIILKFVAWISVPVLAVSGLVVTIDLLRNWKKYFRTKWSYIKSLFLFSGMILFLVSFFGNKYYDFNLGGKDPYFWYAFLYTAAIALFGVRRVVVTKKKYVTRQTILLFLIQALPLFIIPNFVLPWMNDHGLISEWVKYHVFLGEEWWRFVGFILAWPLFIWNIFTESPSIFWLVVSLIQTFVIIPWLVIKYGKGAYCGWICSCGALAETMGDEYRNLSPHGPRWKKLENAGQVILFSIFAISILHALGWHPSLAGALEGINFVLIDTYKVVVDTFLAGTVGVAFYFFFGGRVWCRFFCPLAALMHIYNKFSTWRILADKKKCISCGLCTKNCHMGIDVMAYAQSGKPLDDVECVNCSACINVCPTGVLSFGRYKKVWNK